MELALLALAVLVQAVALIVVMNRQHTLTDRLDEVEDLLADVLEQESDPPSIARRSALTVKPTVKT